MAYALRFSDMSGTGGCNCGQVTYEFEGDPVATVVCHCSHCQRQSGGAYSVNLVMPEGQLTIDGELSVFEDRGESGDAVYVYRKFCGSCGSPIISTFVEPAGIVALKAGTLDDTSAVAPQAQYWVSHKQDWVDIPELEAIATQ